MNLVGMEWARIQAVVPWQRSHVSRKWMFSSNTCSLFRSVAAYSNEMSLPGGFVSIVL